MKDQSPRKLIPSTQRELIDEYLVESQHMGYRFAVDPDQSCTTCGWRYGTTCHSPQTHLEPEIEMDCVCSLWQENQCPVRI